MNNDWIKPSPLRANPAAAASERRCERRALVIDDDSILAEYAVSILNRCGIDEALAVTSTTQARSALSAFKPDLVICDISMPEIDGFEMLEIIRDECPSVGVIVCSSYDERIVLAATAVAISIGFPWVHHLLKPIVETELADLVEQFFNERVPAEAVFSRTKPSADDLRAGEYIAYFQPQVETNDPCKLVGIEALVRWRNKSGLLHSPEDFLDMVEAADDEKRMLYSILPAAFALIEALKPSWPDVRLSLNVSPALLADKELLTRITTVCREHRIAPGTITLELTEVGTRTVKQWETMLANASRARLAGICVAINDFGTGESSAERLAVLPVEEVKFDRIFVRAARHFEHVRTLLASLRTLAADLGARTVLEGVQMDRDLELARDLRFDVVQGYLISQPLTGQELLARYR